MQIDRDLECLNRRRIVYRRFPITDVATDEYTWGWYYEDGTYEYYDLFRSKAKITTYKSLKWHLLVVWYLNPQLDAEDFNDVASLICDKGRGFITFDISPSTYDRIVYDVSMLDLDEPPRNKARRVIFKIGTGLETNEKLKIVGELIGRSKRIHEDDIYQCMLDINELNQRITFGKIADILKCSKRTIQRNMGEELKREKELLNSQTQ
jgi:hypothetical protein